MCETLPLQTEYDKSLIDGLYQDSILAFASTSSQNTTFHRIRRNYYQNKSIELVQKKAEIENTTDGLKGINLSKMKNLNDSLA